MPHDRQEELRGSYDWWKRTPSYHTRGVLRGGNMMWQGICVSGCPGEVHSKRVDYGRSSPDPQCWILDLSRDELLERLPKGASGEVCYWSATK